MHSPPLCAYGNQRSLLQSPVPVTRGTPVYSEPLSSGKYPPGGLVKLRPRGYDTHMRVQSDLTKNRRRNRTALVLLAAAVLVLSFICLFVGSSHMTIAECFSALAKKGSPAQVRIIWNIRIPRVLAAIIAGAGLSVSGLIMQTDVSNAAVFGANLSIIAFAGGFLDTGNHLSSYTVGANPYATSLMAFLFSTVSILLILGLCRLRAFQPGVVVLAGIALGSVWTAATTILQFYATDVGLSAAVIWTFGDLGRATYRTDCIMAAVVLVCTVFFMVMSWQFNALLSGDAAAKSMGVAVDRLRFVSMLLASVITAVCVSFLGIIGFVGIICPHVTKKLLGQDHRVSVPASVLSGSLLLLLADTLSRSLGNGSALPVGAITSLLGAPFFLAIIFSGKGEHN